MSQAAAAADLLSRAAKTLRKHAEAASPAPWEAHPDGLVWADRIGDPVSGSTEVGDANYIALMHPPVALALAVWLEKSATIVATYEGAEFEDKTGILAAEPLAVARAVLREDES